MGKHFSEQSWSLRTIWDLVLQPDPKAGTEGALMAAASADRFNCKQYERMQYFNVMYTLPKKNNWKRYQRNRIAKKKGTKKINTKLLAVSNFKNIAKKEKFPMYFYHLIKYMKTIMESERMGSSIYIYFISKTVKHNKCWNIFWKCVQVQSNS